MKEDREWFVYIIECKDKELYTGITLDVEKRVAKHNKGLGCRYTKYRWPVNLIYKEAQTNKSCAIKRELEIKRLKRAEKLKLIKNNRSFGLGIKPSPQDRFANY